MSFFVLFFSGERQEENQQTKETLSGKGVETAESHRNTHGHFKKTREFQQYQELYLLRVLPCLKKEEELRKTLEDPSLSGKETQVALDLERLEGILSSIKSEVQTIESSLEWTSSNSLISAVKEFQLRLQETERIVEQGKHCQKFKGNVICIEITKPCGYNLRVTTQIQKKILFCSRS